MYPESVGGDCSPSALTCVEQVMLGGVDAEDAESFSLGTSAVRENATLSQDIRVNVKCSVMI
jgi:hypothetical protein